MYTKRNFALLLAGATGLFFVLSALAKLFPAEVFELTLLDQGIVGSKLAAGVAARLIVSLELLMGLILLLGLGMRRKMVVATGGLLLVFCLHLAWLIATRGNEGNCGCMGGWLAMSPLSGILKNLVMLAGLAFAWRHLPKDAVPAWKWSVGLAIATGISIFLLFPMALPEQVVQNGTVAESASGQEFAKYRQFSTGEVDLMKGRKLLALFSLDCEHCKAAARTIADMAAEREVPELHCLFFGEEELVDDFLGYAGRDFSWMMPPAADFFRHLAAYPPRIVLLKDGEIEQDWEGEAFTREVLEVAVGL